MAIERGPAPDLGALRALQAVAATGSLTRAGVALGVSQQAVSLRIRALEGSIGATLLARSAHGSTLTPTGHLVAGWAEPLLAAAESFSDLTAALHGTQERTLRVAASLTIAEHLLPGWWAAWRADHGATSTLHVTAANSAAVVEAVRDGSVDLGFIETPDVPEGASGGGSFGSVTVARDELVAVVAPDHPWASRMTVSARELAREPLLVREDGSGTRTTWERALDAAGLTAVSPAAVLTSTLGIRTAAAAGQAPAVLSILAVADDARAGRLHLLHVTDLDLIRPLTAIWHHNPSPLATSFLEVIARR